MTKIYKKKQLKEGKVCSSVQFEGKDIFLIIVGTSLVRKQNNQEVGLDYKTPRCIASAHLPPLKSSITFPKEHQQLETKYSST